MPVPFAAIDAATIASLNKGEERALEQIFRTHFDALLERAYERLKEERGPAPRLVAAVIRELWEEREGFHTSTEIEAFLNEELRHRARAVRSRVAAVHRFEKAEGVTAAPHAPPTADQLWSEILAALHKPVVDPADMARRRREHAAHDAAAHIAHVAARRSWKMPVIVGSVGAICLLLAYLWAARASDRAEVSRLLVEADTKAVLTSPGQIGSLTLADSSKVRLGAESKLVVIPKFGREYRTVRVAGSAAVVITAGHALPLEVRVGDASVRAVDGEIAVRDFPDEPAIYVLARTAGAEVSSPGGERTLAAGQALAIGRDSTMRDADAAEVAQAFGWLDGKLVLRDVTVTRVLRQVARWYGMEVTLTDSTFGSRTMSLDTPLDSSKVAIAAIEEGGGLRFEWVENRMTFKPAAAKKR